MLKRELMKDIRRITLEADSELALARKPVGKINLRDEFFSATEEERDKLFKKGIIP